ncbi:MAG TPA: hypothetical protein VKY81_09795, partial [Natronosporangium sp.]|nr:hypothetical protein [Natronosporangium sp.]
MTDGSRAPDTAHPDPPAVGGAGAAARRRLLVDLTPLRASRPYRWLWVGAALSGIGTQLTTVVVALQVYDV